MANAIKILILLMIYTVIARSRPTILSQMRLGQKLKMHANIALSLEKVEFDAFFGKFWLD